MMNTMGRVTSELQARTVSTIWGRNIRVGVELIMQRIMIIRKRKKEFEMRREYDEGRVDKDKLLQKNLHNMQDQVEG